jgi:hypothetical protein
MTRWRIWKDGKDLCASRPFYSGRAGHPTRGIIENDDVRGGATPPLKAGGQATHPESIFWLSGLVADERFGARSRLVRL